MNPDIRNSENTLSLEIICSHNKFQLISSFTDANSLSSNRNKVKEIYRELTSRKRFAPSDVLVLESWLEITDSNRDFCHGNSHWIALLSMDENFDRSDYQLRILDHKIFSCIKGEENTKIFLQIRIELPPFYQLVKNGLVSACKHGAYILISQLGNYWDGIFSDDFFNVFINLNCFLDGYNAELTSLTSFTNLTNDSSTAIVVTSTLSYGFLEDDVSSNFDDIYHSNSSLELNIWMSKDKNIRLINTKEIMIPYPGRHYDYSITKFQLIAIFFCYFNRTNQAPS